jgi:hypothetical protein
MPALAPPVTPLFNLLSQMRSMIERLEDEAYCRPAPGRTSGGVGGHVRHCLDHIAALLNATRSGVVEYDRRRRGTPVETCRMSALQEIAALAGELARLDDSVLDEPLLVESQIDPAVACAR